MPEPKLNRAQRRAMAKEQEKREAAQVKLRDLKAEYYQIAAFGQGESPRQVDPRKAAKRQQLAAKHRHTLIAAVKVWADPRQSEKPESDWVQTWWEVELLAEGHGGVTPEGKALSGLLKVEAFKHLGTEGYLKWERENRKTKADTLQLWAEENEKETIASQPSILHPLSGSSAYSADVPSVRNGNKGEGSEGSASDPASAFISAADRIVSNRDTPEFLETDGQNQKRQQIADIPAPSGSNDQDKGSETRVTVGGKQKQNSVDSGTSSIFTPLNDVMSNVLNDLLSGNDTTSKACQENAHRAKELCEEIQAFASTSGLDDNRFQSRGSLKHATTQLLSILIPAVQSLGTGRTEVVDIMAPWWQLMAKFQLESMIIAPEVQELSRIIREEQMKVKCFDFLNLENRMKAMMKMEMIKDRRTAVEGCSVDSQQDRPGSVLPSVAEGTQGEKSPAEMIRYETNLTLPNFSPESESSNIRKTGVLESLTLQTDHVVHHDLDSSPNNPPGSESVASGGFQVADGGVASGSMSPSYESVMRQGNPTIPLRSGTGPSSSSTESSELKFTRSVITRLRRMEKGTDLPAIASTLISAPPASDENPESFKIAIQEYEAMRQYWMRRERQLEEIKGTDRSK